MGTVLSLLAAVSAAMLGYVLCRIWHLTQERTDASIALDRATKQVEDTRRIVGFRHAGPTDPRTRLALRAGPNERLVPAFGIENSFTTRDINVHHRFKKTAREIMSSIDASPQGWTSLYEKAHDVLDREVLRESHNGNEISLAPCVRRFCLRVVLDFLFQVADQSDLDDADVSAVTEEINAQWVKSKSKSKSKNGGVAISQSDRLNSALAALMGHTARPDAAPQEALSFILPAYESLWRVVLLTFVSACHRGGRPMTATELGELGVPGCLGVKTGRDGEQRALRLAKEGLRLYPSARRLYRARSLTPDHPYDGNYKSSLLNKDEVDKDEGDWVRADVAACHRNEAIWGADALEFRPGRFDKLTDLQKRAYFPFSIPNNECPAHAGFGERLVTLLVVVLGVRLGRDRDAGVFFADQGLDGDRMCPLPAGREDMEAWVVRLRGE